MAFVKSLNKIRSSYQQRGGVQIGYGKENQNMQQLCYKYVSEYIMGNVFVVISQISSQL